MTLPVKGPNWPSYTTLVVRINALEAALREIAEYPEIPHLEEYADWREVRRIAKEAL